MKKVGFKLTKKKIVIDFNYKENGLLDFQVTRFRSLIQKEEILNLFLALGI